ncbi:MAG: twin-arginine translocase TatA/TatE family subunit [Gemmatimonadetes bacterium]|jgi:sec-independent protein translocase protein TatA|nr:MAG: twin-arginine translocase TatA/TatE family subunit [Gemmatimonadota bacterium]
MLGNLSGSEIVILMLIVLLVFGANRLPDAGKAVGKGLREFKRALSEAEDSIQRLPPSSSAREGEQPRDGKPKRLVE